jgi:TolB-like protein/Tfp pilus assembly protein PilF
LSGEERAEQTVNYRSSSSSSVHFEFKTKNSAPIFDYLAKSFVHDYMTRRFAKDDSGWRSLSDVARNTGMPVSVIYGKQKNQLSPAVQELLQRGFVEERFFRRERGRGGEVMRLRVAYEKEPIKNYVHQKITAAGVSGSTSSRKAVTSVYTEEPAVPTKTSEELDKRRIAILPFTNISLDSKDEYFADGMTEELISTVSKISGLKVIARTSVVVYKNELNKKKIDEIASELRAGTILEGSVRKSGDKLRITAQLIDSKDSRHLWSETYDREFKDVFAIQSDIAQTVAHALKVRLFAPEKESISKEPTKNVEAHTWYLKGLQLAEAGEDEDIQKAVRYFENAIRLDPNFANAYAQLGDIYTLALGHSFNISYGEAVLKARELITKALQLDEQSAQAHLSLSNTEWYFHGLTARGRLAEEKEIKRAIELDPNYAKAHQMYALHLLQRGNFEEARAELKQALELDPILWYANYALGDLLYYERRYEEAINYMNHFQKIFAEHEAMAIYRIAMCAIQLSKLDEAVSLLKNAIEKKPLGGPEASDYLGLLGFAYAKQGKVPEANAILEDMESRIRTKILPEYLLVDVARIHFALGEKEKTLRVFESALERKESFALWLLGADPVWDDLRSAPRFISLLKKTGLISHEQATETERRC